MEYILIALVFGFIGFFLYKRLTGPQRKKSGTGGGTGNRDNKEDNKNDHLQNN